MMVDVHVYVLPLLQKFSMSILCRNRFLVKVTFYVGKKCVHEMPLKFKTDTLVPRQKCFQLTYLLPYICLIAILSTFEYSVSSEFGSP